MEQKIIKLLLNHQFHNRLAGQLSRTQFGTTLQPIFDTITEAHEKFKTDLTTDEVRELYFSSTVLTTQQKKEFRRVLAEIEEEELPNPEIAQELIRRFYKRDRHRQIAEVAVKALNGEGDPDELFNSIRTILDNTKNDGPVIQLPEVSKDLDQLLKENSPENRFAFRFAPLQNTIKGAGRGNNIIIFGRPEVGKSSLIAYLVAGYLQQDLKVAYFANEEPGPKIMLNVVRSLYNKSDAELVTDIKQIKSDWTTVSEKLNMFDAVGLSANDIRKYAEQEKPDVIVIDQTDKLTINGQFNANHERLKELYVYTREIGKRSNSLMVNISQASAEAEGCREVTFNMLDNSKTGKAGEADIIIGVGKNPQVQEDNTRYLTVSKNKISGWHGMITCMFDPIRCQFAA